MAVIALISALMLDQSRERPHGLDHLRALAILLVLVFHYRAYYGIPEALIDALRDSGVLRTGEVAHLKPRRIRQFTAEGTPAPAPANAPVAGGVA